MRLIDTQIELNEDFLPNSNLTYDIFYDDKKTFEARLREEENKGRVGVEDAPKVLRYTLDKPLDKFTREEIDQVLNYRGLCFEHDGFEISDVFMEKSFITLQLTITKGRFLEWYFEYGQDQENKELKIDLANSIIDQMFKVGFGSMSVNELFDSCNQESIRAYYTEQYDMQTDEFDTELSDLGIKYNINLVE